MLSSTSLAAFSGATPTTAAQRAPPVVQARAPQPDQVQRQAGPAPALPETRPSLPPPRGSLLNLSV